jgi:hypothetical protein
MDCLGIARRSWFRRIMVDDEVSRTVRFLDFEIPTILVGLETSWISFMSFDNSGGQ